MKGTLGFLEHFSYTKHKRKRLSGLENPTAKKYIAWNNGLWTIFIFKKMELSGGHQTKKVCFHWKRSLAIYNCQGFIFPSSVLSFCSCRSYCGRKTLQWPPWTLSLFFFFPGPLRQPKEHCTTPGFQLKNGKCWAWVCLEDDLWCARGQKGRIWSCQLKRQLIVKEEQIWTSPDQ